VKVRTTGIDHVVWTVPDVEGMLAWYRDELGLEPLRVEEWRAGKVPFVSLRVSEGTLIDLFEGERTGENVNHIALVVEGVSTSMSSLRRAASRWRWARPTCSGRAARAEVSTCATPLATVSSCAPTPESRVARALR
jgi:catechol 2,3-dioxygenase-like lactoylglutathione lyase family enzyme